MTAESETSNVNIAKLREMCVRGKKYREEIEVDYYGESTAFEIRPLVDVEFLPIIAALDEKLGIDAEEAQEMVEEDRIENDGAVDASNFDEEFVQILQMAAAYGMTEEERPDEDKKPEEAAEWDERFEVINEQITGLQSGKSLEIGEAVLDISSDAEDAQSFRGGRGGE